MKFFETSKFYTLKKSTYINLRWIGIIGQLISINIVYFYLNFQFDFFLANIAVFAGIGKSFMIWSDIEYEKEYQNTQKILQSNGPPKLILNKKAGVSNE